jgi:hypothetical protein
MKNGLNDNYGKLKMNIFCCQCNRDVNARLTSGSEVYSHRTDLALLPFWKCDDCGNFVGCHHKTKNKTRPLGCIPTKEIKEARVHIHKILDPLWKEGPYKRKSLYKKISDIVGYNFHTANIRTIDEARRVYLVIKGISQGVYLK